MTQIALLNVTPTGFGGRLRTLHIDTEISIVAVAPGTVPNWPDYAVYIGDGSNALNIGAGWKREGKTAGAYISVTLDDPALSEAINARLFPSLNGDNSHVLLWSRPRRPKAAPPRDEQS